MIVPSFFRALFRALFPASPAAHAGRVRAALLAALVALVGLLAFLGPPARAAGAGGGRQAPAAGGPIDYFELSGVIDPVSAQAFIGEIGAAERSGSALLVVRLDTTGGLKSSVTSVVDRMVSSTVPIAVWIAPQGAQASGAGELIAAAAPILAMAPGTTVGPLTPVNLDSRTAPAGPAQAELARAAAASGRPAAVLRGGTAVVDDTHATQSGFVTFQAGELGTVLQNLQNRSVSSGGQSVSLTVSGELRFHKMSLWARVVHAADRPAVAYMLVLLGFFGLVFELYFPGIGAAGLMGGGALALGLYGFSVLPASWLAVVMLLAGLALYVPDLHTGGLGIYTGAGLVLEVLGSLLVLRHVPSTLQMPWWAVLMGIVGSLLFFISIMTAAIRARFSRPPAGAEGLLGGVGVARTDLAPDGEVNANGSLWRARTLGAAIAEGTKVRVKGVSGLMLMVEPLELGAEEAEVPAGEPPEAGGVG